MKEDFKKWLNLHKGKSLTKEMIDMISTQHEDHIFNMLYNEGLVLESLNTGKTINTDGEVKDWAVKDYQWKTEREFKTLKGAIKYSQQ
jgi:hypothetical protein